MRQLLAVPALCVLASFAAPQARESVAFFGLAPGEDPLRSSYFVDRVYWAMSVDSVLAPVSPGLWKPFEDEIPVTPDNWRLSQFRGLAQNSGARFFVLAFQEPYQYVSRRIWWKPWGLTVRYFCSVRIRIYGAESDSALYEGVVAYEDSLKRITPLPYVPPADHSNPAAYDAWQRETYAGLAGPTVRGIRAAVTGKPLASAVFVKEPPKPEKKAKKK